MTTDTERALRILAGCPIGATADALRANGCDDGVMAYLVTHDLALVRVERFTNPRGLVVTRYSISDQGRVFLKCLPEQ